MSLQKLQDEFILYLFKKENSFNIDEVNGGSDRLLNEERLDVHRQTIMENLVNSLQITYPGIWQLLGQDCARGVALSYIHEMQYLPENGMMANYGSNFPEYLAKFPSTKHLVYIKDFATYEWLKSNCYHAKFDKAIGFDELQAMAEDDLEEAKFIFNDSVQFFSSDYQVDAIQSVLDNPEEEFISIPEGKYFFIIFQNQGRVVTNNIKCELWNFLQEMQSGQKFREVVDKYQDQPEFDFSGALRFIVENQLVKQIL